jgi:carboxypeptidase C (cathepsin A)
MLQSKLDALEPWRAQLETTEKLKWKGQKRFKNAKFFSVGEA